MSKSKQAKSSVKSAVALQYGAEDAAPIVVASGMGYMAEKIVEAATDNGVPIYEDNSLATVLAQLQLGQEIPEELYKAIVEIYVYFLRFDPTQKEEETAEDK
ncbi:MAG: type III secretion protein [Clostridiales bacterium]|nr:type III secretion protein [Clostridiales bacterium]